MANGNRSVAQSAREIAAKAEKLKLEQELVAATAKEAAAVVAEIDKDVASWENKRPVLETFQASVAESHAKINRDIESLPRDVHQALDKIIEDYDKSIEKLEEEIEAAAQLLSEREAILETVKTSVSKARSTIQHRTADGRQKGLDQVLKRLENVDGLYDSRRRAEAYMQFRLSNLDPSDAILTALFADLPSDSSAQSTALENAFDEWNRLRAGNDQDGDESEDQSNNTREPETNLHQAELDLAEARRNLDALKAELDAAINGREEDLLKQAAEQNELAEGAVPQSRRQRTKKQPPPADNPIVEESQGQ